jgi:transcription antitermination protein NusB
MGKRSTARRIAMQVLYQADLAGSDPGTAHKNIAESENFIPETLEFAEQLAQSAWEDRDSIDQEISKLAIDWPIDRIGKVDRSVLRLAIHELKKGDTPSAVVINEAVELAKKYSSQEAAKFINGILGAYLRKK